MLSKLKDIFKSEKAFLRELTEAQQNSLDAYEKVKESSDRVISLQESVIVQKDNQLKMQRQRIEKLEQLLNEKEGITDG